MKWFVDVVVLEEEVEGLFEKLFLVEIWVEVYFIKIYLEFYEIIFKILKFEIKVRKENWFIFFDIEFYIKFRLCIVVGVCVINFIGVGNGVGVYIWFINDYVSWFIKVIWVKLKG